MRPRLELRERTAAEHERVDSAFSRFDLATADGYRRFLRAQAAALLPVEAALDRAGAETVLADWPLRRRGALLRADLAELRAGVPEPFVSIPIFTTSAAILGAIYVLEGSRLGGALLKRTLPGHFPGRFLNARQDPQRWRDLTGRLDESLAARDQFEAAAVAAREIFARFESAAEDEYGAAAA